MITTKEDAQKLLETYVEDDYQKLHAQMVACALEGYAIKNELSKDEVFLYWLTGYLHDIFDTRTNEMSVSYRFF